MSGGPKFEYLWADGGKYKKPTPLPAPQYVSLLMDWVETQINNETLFPVSTGNIISKVFFLVLIFVLHFIYLCKVLMYVFINIAVL
jgi:hypothetical protein